MPRQNIPIRQLPDGKFIDIEFVNLEGGIEYVGPHRHEYFEIFWVLEGEGCHSIDFVQYPLVPGRLYFIKPGQVHESRELADRMYAISFNPDLISPDFRSQLAIEKVFLQNRVAHPFILIDEEGEEALKQLLDVMSNEISKPSFDRDLLSLLMTSFLRFVMRYRPEDDENLHQSDERMTKLLAYIDEYYTTNKEAKFYAEKMALTTKRVNELTRLHFSKTLTQLIHDRVILEACRQLVFTNSTVKSIALDLGYEDTAYFSRFFRKITLKSPQQFREETSK